MADISKEENNFSSISERFAEGVKGVRAGRASASMVEGVQVQVYGSPMPISHIASISTPDPKSIIVTPWDKANLPAIETALSRANLGLSIVAEKDQIRLTLQPMSEEKRKETAKIIGKMAEEARIHVRRVRDEVWKLIQQEEQEGKISEDQKFKQKEKMEELVKKTNSRIAELAEKKEREILELLQ